MDGIRSETYTFAEQHPSGYPELVRTLYKEFLGLQNEKILSWQRTFSATNPFLHHGRWQNLLLFRGSVPVAHASFIIDERQPNDVGIVGFFECINDDEAAQTIFHYAQQSFQEQQRTCVRGPIDLTVWQQFRVSLPSVHPPFSHEPFTPGYYHTLFQRNGFTVAQRNRTTSADLTTELCTMHASADATLRTQGYSAQMIDVQKDPALIHTIYGLTMRVFKDAWSFVSLDEEEFLFLQSPTRKGDLESLWLFVVRDPHGGIAGFLYGFLDAYDDSAKTHVVKTLVIDPAYQGKGLGKMLLHAFYRQAHSEGAATILFSTMRDGNASILAMTGTNNALYRRYEVYERNLA